MNQADVPWVQRGMFVPPPRRRSTAQRASLVAICLVCVASTSATAIALWDHVKVSQSPDRQQAIDLLHSLDDRHRVTAVRALFDDTTEAVAELQAAAKGSDEPAEHARIALKKLRERLR